jgi:hypothetical protein
MTYGQFSAVSQKTHRTGHRVMTRITAVSENSKIWRFMSHAEGKQIGTATRDRWQLRCRNYWILASDAVWPIPSADKNAQSQSYSCGRHWIPSPWLRKQLNNTNNYTRVTIKQELSSGNLHLGCWSPFGKWNVRFLLLLLLDSFLGAFAKLR